MEPSLDIEVVQWATVCGVDVHTVVTLVNTSDGLHGVNRRLFMPAQRARWDASGSEVALHSCVKSLENCFGVSFHVSTVGILHFSTVGILRSSLRGPLAILPVFPGE